MMEKTLFEIVDNAARNEEITELQTYRAIEALCNELDARITNISNRLSYIERHIL